MRLVLADDHTLFRDAIVQYILRAEPDAEIMVARDLHGAMEIAETVDRIDLMLLDLRMPGMDGLMGLKKIRDRWPQMAVALLSGFAEEQDVRQAMALGARGYFPKTMPGPILIGGIRKIIEGGNFVAMDNNTNKYMPSHFSAGENRAAAEQAVSQDENVFRLTPRESEVLGYLASGISNKEIARALDLQVVTVKLHVRGICRKLGALNRTQAALKAREMGLVPPEAPPLEQKMPENPGFA